MKKNASWETLHNTPILTPELRTLCNKKINHNFTLEMIQEDLDNSKIFSLCPPNSAVVSNKEENIVSRFVDKDIFKKNKILEKHITIDSLISSVGNNIVSETSINNLRSPIIDEEILNLHNIHSNKKDIKHKSKTSYFTNELKNNIKFYGEKTFNFVKLYKWQVCVCVLLLSHCYKIAPVDSKIIHNYIIFKCK